MGCDKAPHDTAVPFLDHLMGVSRVLQNWGEPQAVCDAGLFHSIFGTELFQDYSVDFKQRPQIQKLIGERAEFLAYVFCIMDLASLDATMCDPDGQHSILARQDQGGHRVPLTDQQYRDLITVQLADWLEQVERYAQLTDPKLGWQPGDAWKHRRTGYRRMAEKLGGKYLQAWRDTYAREPVATRHLSNDVTPPVQHVNKRVVVG
ncbi:hypothetical protein WJX73_006614 [Symbiochloris irregularis]|uniref:DUF6817 domain-containing protein n=1 Tax=Symbiochloris irregularis TaxID=706552 RepID=A0AAW1P652_9CHLO